MSEKDALKGLSCPRCGGMVTIPEGQAIVICPFCEMRSVVRGENGVRRYQVPLRVERPAAEESFRRFLGSNLAIAGSVKRQAKLTEVLLMHLPFWTTWGRALGWVFGKKKHSSGKNTYYTEEEVRIVEDLTWNTAACEVGEFGVTQIDLTGRPLEPFNGENLHRSGMVFEPTGSAREALVSAQADFEQTVRGKANLDQIGQAFVRIVRLRQGLVYYPLWLLRYDYRGRSFQVVVDGFSGDVLYGKAPGNLYYRAGVLVGGMAAGAVLSIDVAYAILDSSSNSSSNDNPLGGAVAAFVAGLALMYFSYRIYRYGEHYVYRRTYPGYTDRGSIQQLPTVFRQVDKIANQLGRFQ